MRLFLHELRVEQRLFWRSREAAFFTFLLPLLLFILLGSVYGSDRLKGGEPLARYLLAGMLGYSAVATGFVSLSITLVIRRESGILKRVRATPLPGSTYLAASLASVLVVFAIEAVLLVVIGRFLFGVGVPDRLGSLVLALLLGALAFAALGVGLTTAIRSAEGSSAVVNMIWLPMSFLSGAFYSPQAYPHFLRAIADVLPLTYLIRLVQAIVGHDETFWSQPAPIAVVAAWGALGVAIALRNFRWEPREG